ncbi:hypothetical protein ACLOJK_014717 [Asimina triloba]
MEEKGSVTLRLLLLVMRSGASSPVEIGADFWWVADVDLCCFELPWWIWVAGPNLMPLDLSMPWRRVRWICRCDKEMMPRFERRLLPTSVCRYRRSVARKKGRRRTAVVGVHLFAIMVAAAAFTVTGLLVRRNSVKICIMLL